MSVLTSNTLCSFSVFCNSRVASYSFLAKSSVISLKFGIKLYCSDIVSSWIGFKVLKRNKKVIGI